MMPVQILFALDSPSPLNIAAGSRLLVKRAGAAALSLLSAPLNVPPAEGSRGRSSGVDRSAPGGRIAAAEHDARSTRANLVEISAARTSAAGLLPRHRRVREHRVRQCAAGSRRDPRALAARIPRRPDLAGQHRQQERDEGASSRDGPRNIIRALAAKPLSLTRPQPADPADQLPLARAAPRCPAPGRPGRTVRRATAAEPPTGRPPWLRRAIVPLAAGAWWERRYLADPPLDRPPRRRGGLPAGDPARSSSPTG